AGLASVAVCRSNPTGRNLPGLLASSTAREVSAGRRRLRSDVRSSTRRTRSRSNASNGRSRDSARSIGPYETRHKDRWSRKPQWAFRAHRREHVQAIAVMLWFKLGSIKKRQAVAVLKRYPNRCRRGHPKNHGLPGCPQCVANAWEERRRLRTSISGQL